MNKIFCIIPIALFAFILIPIEDSHAEMFPRPFNNSVANFSSSSPAGKAARVCGSLGAIPGLAVGAPVGVATGLAAGVILAPISLLKGNPDASLKVLVLGPIGGGIAGGYFGALLGNGLAGTACAIPLPKR